MNWEFFAIYFLWMTGGLIFHLLTKFVNAHEKPNYSWKTFVHMNWPNALLGFFSGCIMVALLSSRQEDLGWYGYVLSLLFGYAGSSLLKNLLKAAKGFFKKLILKWFQ